MGSTSHKGADLRARAWTTITAINDLSIRRLEWHDKVVFHFPDGSEFKYADYTVRADQFRNIRFIGQRWSVLEGQTAEQARALDLNIFMTDGVLYAINPSTHTAVVRPEIPDLLYPWCLPNPLMGLGRFVNLNQHRYRSDHLLECRDLRVASENDREVVLQGTGRLDHRLFEHRVKLDARTGDVLQHEVLDSRWGTPFVDWRMPTWAEAGDARLPTRVEYRVYRTTIDEEKLAALKESLASAGISSSAGDPSHPDYRRWIEVRDRVLPDKDALVQLATDWQSCDTTILSVNPKVDATWYNVPPLDGPFESILSTVLEAQVDQLKLEPSPAKPAH